MLCVACRIQDTKRTYVIGYMDLPRSGSSGTELCVTLELLRNTTAAATAQGAKALTTPPPGWSFSLAALRFVLQGQHDTETNLGADSINILEAGLGLTTPATHLELGFDHSHSNKQLAALNLAIPAGLPSNTTMATSTNKERMKPAGYAHMAASEDMVQLERHMRKASTAGRATVAVSGSHTMGLASSATHGDNVSSSQERVWKELQRQHDWADGQVVFESLYSTCNMEDLEECADMCNAKA
jgi:hypothetical protein